MGSFISNSGASTAAPWQTEMATSKVKVFTHSIYCYLILEILTMVSEPI